MQLQDIVMLREHLSYNFYPPIAYAYDCAVEAIEAVNEGEPDKEIETPSGRLVLAIAIIEELRLEYFLIDELLEDE